MNYYLIKNRMTKQDLSRLKGTNMSRKQDEDNFIEFVLATIVIGLTLIFLGLR